MKFIQAIKKLIKNAFRFFWELVVGIFFLSLLIYFSSYTFTKFWNYQKEELLKSSTQSVLSHITSQHDTSRTSNDTFNRGVCFKDAEYILFKTSSDYSHRVVAEEQRFNLKPTLHFANHTLPFDCEEFRKGCIIFRSQTGEVLTQNEGEDFSIVLFDHDTNNEYIFSFDKAGEIGVK